MTVSFSAHRQAARRALRRAEEALRRVDEKPTDPAAWLDLVTVANDLGSIVRHANTALLKRLAEGTDGDKG